MHTLGDGLVLVQNESVYKSVVSERGSSAFLRQTFIDRAGTCAITPGETAAMQVLLHRLDTGAWGALDTANMNSAAFTMGAPLNVFPALLGGLARVARLRPAGQSDPVCQAQFPAG